MNLQIDKNSNNLFIIFGPTSSGKTKLALELAKFLNNNTEIISADSRQIYKDCQIGTGSIDNNVFGKSGLKIHLTEFLPINESYSVSEWQKSAYKLIDEIRSKNKIPIIVGGTGLYIDSLIYKRNYGNDLEPFSSYDISLLTPDIERSEVYEKINHRVEEMFEMGFVNEVKNLIKKQDSFPWECVPLKRNGRGNYPILQGAGYKQITEYLNNLKLEESGKKIEVIPRFKQKYILDLETCKEKVKIAYRNYAKRQYTWFRKYFEDFEVKKIKV